MKETITPEKLRRMNGMMIVVILFGFLFPVAYQLWEKEELGIVNTLTMDNFQVESPVELCPGEKLVFSYDFKSEGKGVLIRDLTTWRMEPPHTIVYSEARRIILQDPVTQHLTETYTIPYDYMNHAVGERTPIEPGRYERRIAVSAPANDKLIDVDHVDFIVKPKEECSVPYQTPTQQP